MAVACRNCPLRKKSLFSEMTAQEVEFMERFKVGELRVAAGTPIFSEGSSSPQLYTVLSGMGLRYKMLSSGDRQVLSFVFPGDFVGLQAAVLGENGHSLDATTDMVLCVFNRNDLWSLFKSNPARAYDLTWVAAVEEHFLGETIASIGQLSAMQRLAWALTRIYLRLRAVDLGRRGVVPLPFTQRDLADALGLSLVHTNKTLKKLAERQLAAWQTHELAVHDLPGLAEIGLIDLDQERKRPLL